MSTGGGQTIRDVVIRFRVEAPRAGAGGMPSAAGVGVPPGAGGAGPQFGVAGGGGETSQLVGALVDLTTTITQLIIVMRLASGAQGIVGTLFGLGGIQGAGRLGGSLLFKGLLTGQRLLPIAGPAGLLGGGALVQAGLTTAISRRLDPLTGTEDLDVPIEARLGFAPTQFLAAGGRLPEVLPAITERLRQRLGRGVEFQERLQRQLLGLPPIPTGEESVRQVALLRGARGRGILAGRAAGEQAVFESQLRGLGNVFQPGLALTPEGSFLLQQQAITTRQTGIERLQARLPDIPGPDVFAAPGERERAQFQALEIERQILSLRLEQGRQVVNLEQQRLQLQQQQIGGAAGLAVRLRDIPPSGLEILGRVQAGIRAGQAPGDIGLLAIQQGLLSQEISRRGLALNLVETLRNPALAGFVTPDLTALSAEIRDRGAEPTPERLAELIQERLDTPIQNVARIATVMEKINESIDRVLSLAEETRGLQALGGVGGDAGAAQAQRAAGGG